MGRKILSNGKSLVWTLQQIHRGIESSSDTFDTIARKIGCNDEDIKVLRWYFVQ